MRRGGGVFGGDNVVRHALVDTALTSALLKALARIQNIVRKDVKVVHEVVLARVAASAGPAGSGGPSDAGAGAGVAAVARQASAAASARRRRDRRRCAARAQPRRPDRAARAIAEAPRR